MRTLLAKSFGRRIFGFFLALIFCLFEFSIYALPLLALTSATSSHFAGPSPLSINVKKITIPSRFGLIDDRYQGLAQKLVIYLQDAHAIPDAQRSLRALIEYFQKKYGIKVTALEGAQGELDATLFRAFPDQGRLRQVFENYLSKGELSGGAAASVLNREKADYVGIEDWARYEEGMQTFQRALKKKGRLLEKTGRFDKEIGILKTKFYSKPAMEFDRRFRNWEDHPDHLRDLLNFLISVKPPDPKIYPALAAIQRVMQLEEPAYYNPPKKYLAVNPVLKNAHGRGFNQEFFKYLKASKKNLFKTAEECRIEAIENQIQWLRRLVRFELSNGDWRKFRGIHRAVKAGQARPEIDSLQKSIFSFLSGLPSEYSDFLLFYQNAFGRDEIFHHNIKRLMNEKKTDALILIAGGFHTENLSGLLRKSGISYVVISPRIKEIPAKSHYLDYMQGKVSWQKYFEAKDGRINLYNAFSHAAVDALLEKKENGRPFLLKTWRDQLIRNLAAEGKIQKAADYTQFLDQAFKNHLGPETLQRLKNRWQEKLEGFISGLQALGDQNQITEAGIAELLDPPANQFPAAVASLVPRSELRLHDKEERTASPSDVLGGRLLDLNPGQLVAQMNQSAGRVEKRPHTAFFINIQNQNLARIYIEYPPLPHAFMTPPDSIADKGDEKISRAGTIKESDFRVHYYLSSSNGISTGRLAFKPPYYSEVQDVREELKKLLIKKENGEGLTAKEENDIERYQANLENLEKGIYEDLIKLAQFFRAGDLPANTQVSLQEFVDFKHLFKALEGRLVKDTIIHSFETTLEGLLSLPTRLEGLAGKADSSGEILIPGAQLHDTVFRGISPEMLDVVEGEIIPWQPVEKRINISLVRPHDTPKQARVKVENEVYALRHIWEAVQANAASDYPKVSFEIADQMVKEAEKGVTGDHERSEIVLEKILRQRPIKRGEDLLRGAHEIIKKRLIPALTEREELVYVRSSNMSHRHIIDRQKELLMIKMFGLMLDLPYGFNTDDPNLMAEQRSLASARRMLLLDPNLFPQLVKSVGSGTPAPVAIRKAIEGIQKLIDQYEERLKEIEARLAVNPKDEERQKSLDFNRHIQEALEEQAGYLQAIAEGFGSYDYIHEFNDTRAVKRERKKSETKRHQNVLNLTRRYLPETTQYYVPFFGWKITNPIIIRLIMLIQKFSNGILDFLHRWLKWKWLAELHVHGLENEMAKGLQNTIGRFDRFVRREIKKGRPIEYASAKFFAYYYSTRKPWRDDAEKPVIDFLMRYYDIALYGDPLRKQDKDIVVFARAIRDETDYNRLQGSLRGHGKIVAILSPKPKQKRELRLPHWFIFAKKGGIVTIPFLNLEDKGLNFDAIRPGDTALADGKKGEVVINPSPETSQKWMKSKKIYQHLDQYYLERVRLETPLSYEYDETSLSAFKSGESDSLAVRSGGNGVGLFRLEEMMAAEGARGGIEMDERRLSLAISEILTSDFFDDRKPLVIRLFDVAEDKRPQFLVRGIKSGKWDHDEVMKNFTGPRFYLSKDDKYRPFREFGKMQLRAVFAAYLHKRGNGQESGQGLPNLKILFSDVRNAEEVQALEDLIEEARGEFFKEVSGGRQLHGPLVIQENEKEMGLLIDRIPIGYMFETSGAVEKERENIFDAIDKIRSRKGTKDAEAFAGIGSNDLTKSILQEKFAGEGLLEDLQPFLVRHVWDIAQSAKRRQIPVALEGEWGNSVKMLFTLLAFKYYGNLDIIPVAATGRIPELLEYARNTTPDALETPLAFKNKGPESFKDLILRTVQGENMPSVGELNQAAAALREIITNRIIDSWSFNRFIEEREEAEGPAGQGLSTPNGDEVSSPVFSPKSKPPVPSRSEMRHLSKAVLQDLLGIRQAPQRQLRQFAGMAANHRRDVFHSMREIFEINFSDWAPLAYAEPSFEGAYRRLDSVRRSQNLTPAAFENLAENLFNRSLESLAEKIRNHEVTRMAPVFFYAPEMKGRLIRFIHRVQEAFAKQGDVTGEGYQFSVIAGDKKALAPLIRELSRGGSLAGIRFYSIDGSEAGLKTLGNRLSARVFQNEKFSGHYSIFFPDRHWLDQNRTLTHSRIVTSEVPPDFGMVAVPILVHYLARSQSRDINAATLRQALPDIFLDSVRWNPGGGLSILKTLFEVIARSQARFAASA